MHDRNAEAGTSSRRPTQRCPTSRSPAIRHRAIADLDPPVLAQQAHQRRGVDARHLGVFGIAQFERQQNIAGRQNPAGRGLTGEVGAGRPDRRPDVLAHHPARVPADLQRGHADQDRRDRIDRLEMLVPRLAADLLSPVNAPLSLGADGPPAPGGWPYFFFGAYKSVIVPSNISAAIITDSLSVGCGWMVRPMSSAVAPISMASPISAIRSPACMPTTPPPMIRPVFSSKTSLVKPSALSMPSARPLAAQGNLPTPKSMPFSFASRSVRPVQATSGSV